MSNVPAGRPIGRYILPGLAALLLALLLLKALDTAGVMLELFSWPFQFDESEGMIVLETLLLDQGQNIFAPIDSRQFVAAPYPPLYYLLNWPAIHLAGATFKAGRLITLFAAMGSALLISLAVFKVTRSYIAAGAGALAWPSLALVGFWGVLVKPDMTGVFFGLAGLVVALYSARGTSAALWWALLFFLAAFFTKQTAIAPALAVCIWLLLLRWRTGLRFTLALLALALGLSQLLDLWTAGGYYYHELTLHDLPWRADVYLFWLRGLLSVYWPLLGFGSLALLGCTCVALARWIQAAGGFATLIRKIGSIENLGIDEPRGWSSSVILLVGYWAAGLGVAAGSGTHGGNHNHLLEWSAGCCIGFGMLVHLLVSARRAWQQALAGAALVLLLVVASPVRRLLPGPLPSLYDVPQILAREYRAPAADVQLAWSNMAQYVSNTAGPVYSSNVSLLIASEKWRDRLWTTDPFTQTHATFYGRWDESELLGAIRNGSFALIVLPYSPETIAELLVEPDRGYGDVSHGIMHAVQDAYEIDQRNILFIYKPKP